MKHSTLGVSSAEFLTVLAAILIFSATSWAQHEQAYPFTLAQGANPQGGLVADGAGNLYGAAFNGGNNGLNSGTVFEMSPPAQAGGNWTQTVLYSFSGADGKNPCGNLILDQAGNLYGVTQSGGADDLGVVFRLAPPAQAGGAWTETVLYQFTGEDGRGPIAGLLFDQLGNLYGTTVFGGPTDSGVVFQLSPSLSGGSWAENILYNFSCCSTDGNYPEAELIFDTAGNLYGTTEGGGTYGLGTVFELSPPSQPGGAWTETVLHSFASKDGANPFAGVVMGESGGLFGTTFFGGAAGFGVVFYLWTPAPGGPWINSVLHSFTSGSDGARPQAALIFGKPGTLYGTTSLGGASGQGTVFQVSRSGSSASETVLYSFTGGKDGGQPAAGLLLHNYALYGTTNMGGASSCANGCGTAFRLGP